MEQATQKKGGFYIKSPEECLQGLAAFFKLDGSYRLAKIAFWVALATSALSYHLMVIYGNGCPDALCEGLVYYFHGSWALACGRWCIPHLNNAFGNFIMPGIEVVGYMLCIWLTVLLLAKLWQLHSGLSVGLATLLMVVTPATIAQSMYTYMFVAWGLSTLLAVLFVYALCRGGRWGRWLGAPLCLALGLGFYQSVVGVVCVCFCATLLLGLLDELPLKKAGFLLAQFIASALLGSGLYFVILKLEMKRYDVQPAERVSEFSLGQIFAELPSSVAAAYSDFWEYFTEAVLHRELLYAGLLGLLGLAFAVRFVQCLRAGRIPHALLALVALAVLPAGANVVRILIPYNEISVLMSYQNVLVFPLLFALLEKCRIQPSCLNLGRHATALLALALGGSCIISANATYKCYEMSYQQLYARTASILNDVYNLPDYEEGDVIALAGFMDDSYLRENLGIYEYACGLTDNVAYWTNGQGTQVCRARYLQNYFGVDAKGIDIETYNHFITTGAFLEMGVYPEKDSIRRVSGMVIVKLSEDAPKI